MKLAFVVTCLKIQNGTDIVMDLYILINIIVIVAGTAAVLIVVVI